MCEIVEARWPRSAQRRWLRRGAERRAALRARIRGSARRREPHRQKSTTSQSSARAHRWSPKKIRLRRAYAWGESSESVHSRECRSSFIEIADCAPVSPIHVCPLAGHPGLAPRSWIQRKESAKPGSRSPKVSPMLPVKSVTRAAVRSARSPPPEGFLAFRASQSSQSVAFVALREDLKRHFEG